jgi:hypothetical protein
VYLFRCFDQITRALQWLVQTESDFIKLVSQHTEEVSQNSSSFPIEQFEQEAEKIVVEYALTKNMDSPLTFDTPSTTELNSDFQPKEKDNDFLTRVLEFLNNLKRDYEAYKLKAQSNDNHLEKRIQRLQEYIFSNTQPK